MKKNSKIKKVIKKAVKKINNPTSPRLRGTSKITPLGDKVLVKPFLIDESKTTASGIIIPETVSKEKPEQGIVIAVGEGKWESGKRVPVAVKVGDKVVFSKYAYEEVKLEGVEYYILKEENILAIIR